MPSLGAVLPLLGAATLGAASRVTTVKPNPEPKPKPWALHPTSDSFQTTLTLTQKIFNFNLNPEPCSPAAHMEEFTGRPNQFKVPTPDESYRILNEENLKERKVLLTEILLPQIARQGTAYIISI